MLRIIDAALNNKLFFSIHTLTVVDVNALYIKPFTLDTFERAGSDQQRSAHHQDDVSSASYYM